MYKFIINNLMWLQEVMVLGLPIVFISQSHSQRQRQIGVHPLAGEEDLAACLISGKKCGYFAIFSYVS